MLVAGVRASELNLERYLPQGSSQSYLLGLMSPWSSGAQCYSPAQNIAMRGNIVTVGGIFLRKKLHTLGTWIIFQSSLDVGIPSLAWHCPPPPKKKSCGIKYSLFFFYQLSLWFYLNNFALFLFKCYDIQSCSYLNFGHRSFQNQSHYQHHTPSIMFPSSFPYLPLPACHSDRHLYKYGC